MKKIKSMFGFFDEEPVIGESPIERRIPTKEEAVEDIRFYSGMLQPAFVKKGFLEPSQDPETRSPLELLAVQEQDFISKKSGKPDPNSLISLRQRTDDDLLLARKTKTKPIPTGAARGIYQRQTGATEDAVNQLRKNPWMMERAFDLVMDSSDPRDLQDLQMLSGLLAPGITDLEVAEVLQKESTDRYSPLIDTMIHLAFSSKGTVKPEAYNRLQDNRKPSHKDITVIQKQKGGATKEKQRQLDRYVEQYINTYSDDGER